MARVYAVDYVEIRLPLTDQQLEFVEAPELLRGDTTISHSPGPLVTLTARLGRKEYSWSAIRSVL